MAGLVLLLCLDGRAARCPSAGRRGGGADADRAAALADALADGDALAGDGRHPLVGDMALGHAALGVAMGFLAIDHAIVMDIERSDRSDAAIVETHRHHALVVAIDQNKRGATLDDIKVNVPRHGDDWVIRRRVRQSQG